MPIPNPVWIEREAVRSAATGGMCLDWLTGAIVPADDCPADDTGDGRAGVAQDKRFLRIPDLTERQQELRSQWDHPSAEDYGEVRVLTQGGAWRALTQAEREELASYARDEIILPAAAEGAVRNWIEALRPPRGIILYEEGQGPVLAYDPEQGKWLDATTGAEAPLIGPPPDRLREPRRERL